MSIFSKSEKTASATILDHSGRRNLRYISGGMIRSALAILVSGCATISPPADWSVIESPIGLIAFEIHGSAGVASSTLKRLVALGMKDSCVSKIKYGIKTAQKNELLVIWDVIYEPTPSPEVMITARLMKKSRLISFAFDKTISPSADPDVVFESKVADITCTLFRKAGYLRPGSAGYQSRS